MLSHRKKVKYLKQWLHLEHLDFYLNWEIIQWYKVNRKSNSSEREIIKWKNSAFYSIQNVHKTLEK